MNENILFHEVQDYGRIQKPVAVAGYAILMSTSSIFLLIGLLGGRLSSRENPNMPISIAAVTAVMWTLLFLFYFYLQLTTEVRTTGLFVRYRPIHFSMKDIPLNHVVSIRVVRFNPILTGYGVRLRWGGKAYTVCGTRAVRLDYASGVHLLIGSQKPEELAAAIRSIHPVATNQGSSPK